ncbi:hypothetical protein C095_08105 [Fusobacterium necrophorum subsp. funduliforme B35]|uniref:Uncharacterized protein n=1 Tax=Fusobacterium necrophorum subsp. funduliforme B35 TaxID=1226633 RepID=A0A0B4EH92_9FUSO|nr:hypothetical protein C095_08105 [Fusobacterium necrophorum subsp. funduliforme B35]
MEVNTCIEAIPRQSKTRLTSKRSKKKKERKLLPLLLEK